MLTLLHLSIALATSAAPLVCGAPEATPSSIQPLSEAAVRELIAPYLGTIDRGSSTEDWRQLPREALPVLEKIAADPKAFATQRALALDGAAALGSDGRIHLRLASDPAAPILVRHAALSALPSILPTDEAQKALVERLSGDADVRIRASAAEIVARTQPARACGAVRAQAGREGREGRAAFHRALSTCEGK